MDKIAFSVNGVTRSFTGNPEMPLLWYLRDSLELTGTKFDCTKGICGTCTVQIDDKTVRSCITPMKSVAGKRIVTIEGLDAGGDQPPQRHGRSAVQEYKEIKEQVMVKTALLVKPEATRR